MPRITEALETGRVRALLLFGTDMLSSFADSRPPSRPALARQDLVVSYDLFLNDTARRFADVVLPGTSWLEELGCKATNTHLYLMEPALPPAGRDAHRRVGAARARAAARRRRLLPVGGRGGAHRRDPRSSGHRPRHRGGPARGGRHARAPRLARGAIPIWHSPRRPARSSSTRRARQASACRRCRCTRTCPPARFPLMLRQGRTLAHFHGFYDHGRALPSLAALEPEPVLWISPADAAARGVADGAAIRMFNERGEMRARARVTDRVPARHRVDARRLGRASTGSPPGDAVHPGRGGGRLRVLGGPGRVRRGGGGRACLSAHARCSSTSGARSTPTG